MGEGSTFIVELGFMEGAGYSYSEDGSKDASAREENDSPESSCIIVGALVFES